jgi:nucleotide-binding universal stress UspA family protein
MPRGTMAIEVMNMSGATLLVIVLVAWFAIGLVLSLVMGRRGHDSFRWLVLGTLLGPLAIALALDSWRHDESLHPNVIAAGGAHQGVDVLVGYDGSRSARVALERISDLLGPRLGRLTLVTVVPYGPTHDVTRLARSELERSREYVAAPVAPTLEIVEGHPPFALESLAERDHYDLIVIGTRGSGLTKRVLGSTATSLARVKGVPVLIVSDPPPDASHETPPDQGGRATTSSRKVQASNT